MNPSPPPEFLLVEDDPQDLELVLRAFEKVNLAQRVRVVRDGAEALEFAFCEGPYAGRDRGAGPKVILLDLKLPKVDGLEVLRRLKGDPRTRLIPVVVLTSSTEPSDIQASYRFGANSYVAKPVNFERFVDVVRELGLYWLGLNQTPFGGA
ncbi:MAG: response regulator [Verrucomicrobia bacterium]|nr:response regulator [Verrucomicrobiota bacterium]